MKIYKICSILASTVLSVWIIISNIIYIASAAYVATSMPIKYIIVFAVINLIAYNLIIWLLYFIIKRFVSKKA